MASCLSVSLSKGTWAAIAVLMLATRAESLTFLKPKIQTGRRLSSLRGGAAAATAGLSSDFVLKTLAPLMGGLVSATMFVSPFSAVLNARKNEELGELNVSPYAVLVQNGWIVAPNVVVNLAHGLNIGSQSLASEGLLTGLFFTYTGYRLGSATQKMSLFRSFASYMSFIAVSLFVALQGFFSIPAKDFMGRVGITLLMIYYCSPLSTIAKVIASRDSSSIDPALTAVGIINGLFWGSYGLAIADIYVYGPNLLGAGIALFTTLTWFAYRPK